MKKLSKNEMSTMKQEVSQICKKLLKISVKALDHSVPEAYLEPSWWYQKQLYNIFDNK